MPAYLVDGNNVMGAGADGWWNDRVGAAARLTGSIANWCLTHEDPVTVVFDGGPEARVAELAGGNLSVIFARRCGRDAADDRIVEMVDDLDSAAPDLTVVTSDRGLVARLPPGVATEGAGRFRERVGLHRGGGPKRPGDTRGPRRRRRT